MAHEWNYDDDDRVRGPAEWARQFPGVGKAQSPIDIQVDYCDLQRHQQQVSCRCAKSLFRDQGEHLRVPPATIGRPQVAHSNNRSDQRRNHLDSTAGDEDQYFEEQLGGRYERSQSTSSGGSAFSGCSSVSSSEVGGQQAPQNGHQNKEKIKYSKTSGQHKAPEQETHQNTRYCATNKKIFLGYPRYLNTVRLSNTGHAWQIDMPAELAQHTLLCGPPLGDREYRLAQLHCHWGSQCDHGSEHLVNGRAYSAEIHFVHWNCSEFSSFEEAAKHKHGLAVLAVLVQALEGAEQNCNKHLEKIVAALPSVSERPKSVVWLENARLDLKKLFPINRWLYAAYEGSLTTPPLSEVVDWIVFLQPITCSRRQLETFRQMRCSSQGDKLAKNCRPVQALNQRVVSIWTHCGQ